MEGTVPSAPPVGEMAEREGELTVKGEKEETRLAGVALAGLAVVSVPEYRGGPRRFVAEALAVRAAAARVPAPRGRESRGAAAMGARSGLVAPLQEEFVDAVP